TGVHTFFSIRTINGKGEIRKFLKSFLSVKFGWKVWAVVLLIGIINLLAWYIPELFGYDRLPMLLPNIYIFPIYFFFMVFFGGGQEEIGWRGYILPFMESKFGLWIGNIILGLVWTAWHLPLWFMVGSTQEFLPFIAFALGCIGLSFLFSWVIKASGNRLFSGLIVHGAFNAFIPLFPTLIMQENVIQTRFWIQEIIILLVGIIFMLTMTRNRNKAV
ncbi:CPBP family intramembrane glutamic endopeptidase, partial [Spirochaeta dissipatitropha]